MVQSLVHMLQHMVLKTPDAEAVHRSNPLVTQARPTGPALNRRKLDNATDGKGGRDGSQDR